MPASNFQIQKASNTALLGSVTATYGQTPTQGNLLVAAVTANVGVGSIAISGWSTAKSVAVGVAGGLIVFYKVAGAGESTAVVATGTAATFMDLHIFEYSDIDNASPLDVTISGADTGAGVTSRSTGTTASTSQPNTLIFTACATAGANGGNTGWTNGLVNQITTTDLMTADEDSTIQGTGESTASWNTSQRAAAIMVTFLEETGDTYGLKYPLKPLGPKLNRNNPITKGLLFDAPLFERGGTTTQDLASRLSGALVASGATWETNFYGADLDFSAAASSITWTTPASLNTLGFLSIEVLFTLRGAGGGSLGRAIHKKNNATGRFQIQAGSSQIRFVVGGSTSSSAWGITQPTLNTWHDYIVTYDGTTSFVNDVPVVYLDGKKQTLATSTQPVGTWVADDTNMYIGNTGAGTRNWDGKIALVRVWNRILNDQEAKILGQNPFGLYEASGLLLRR